MGIAPSMSPNKNGNMQEDKFWLLKTEATNTFTDDGLEIHPVTSMPTTLELYRIAPQLSERNKKVAATDSKFLGRRVNNEVELFVDDDGKETPGLRKSLESKGLTVRTYAPEKEIKKFPKPSHKAIMGEEKTKNLLINKCMEHLQARIEKEECTRQTDVDFGLIGDVGNDKKKTLAIARVEEAEYEAFKAGEKTSFSMKDPYHAGEIVCNIIGTVKDSEPTFTCEEQVTKSYFNSIGMPLDFLWMDVVETRKQEAIAAKKVQKRQEKKHRRQVTASTITSPSEKSCTTMSTESNETVKARQREKANAKRKAQKQRRKLEKEGADAETLALTDSSKTDDDKPDGEDEEKVEWEIMGDAGTHFILQNKEHGTKILPRQDLTKLGANAVFRIKPKDSHQELTLGTTNKIDTCGSDSDEKEEEDNGLRVVFANSAEDFHRAYGDGVSPLLTLAKAEQARKEKELQFLGNGL